jgi:hypothetical protein
MCVFARLALRGKASGLTCCTASIVTLAISASLVKVRAF